MDNFESTGVTVHFNGKPWKLHLGKKKKKEEKKKTPLVWSP